MLVSFRSYLFEIELNFRCPCCPSTSGIPACLCGLVLRQACVKRVSREEVCSSHRCITLWVLCMSNCCSARSGVLLAVHSRHTFSRATVIFLISELYRYFVQYIKQAGGSVWCNMFHRSSVFAAYEDGSVNVCTFAVRRVRLAVIARQASKMTRMIAGHFDSIGTALAARAPTLSSARHSTVRQTAVRAGRAECHMMAVTRDIDAFKDASKAKACLAATTRTPII